MSADLRRRSYSAAGLIALTTALSIVAVVPALGAPAIQNISPRGLQIGGKTVLTIDGADLAADSRLLLPFPVASQTVQPGATNNRLQIEVTLDAGLSPGIYELRLANGGGISPGVAIGVDEAPQQAFAEQAVVPVALHGAVSGSQILKTTVHGAKDQRLVCDLEAQRLGSELKPVVRIYDSRGAQLAWSGPQQKLSGDARCEAVLPADGDYTIEVHDVVYRAGSPGFFRLSIGALEYADMVFPPAISRSASRDVEFLGSSGASAKSRMLTADAAPGVRQMPVNLPSGERFTGAAPRVLVSDFPELVEAPAGGERQNLGKAPVGISGRLAARGEEDHFLLEVQPGSNLRFQVHARQLGSPVDALLTIRNEQMAGLASADDSADRSDPVLDFTAPAGVEKLIVSIKDLRGQGGADYVYHLTITDLARPDFSLAVETGEVNLLSQGTQTIKVNAVRSGYNGPIQLDIPGLPPDIQLSGGTIAAGDTIGLLSLTAAASAPHAGVFSLRGQATEGSEMVTRIARRPESSVSRNQPWLREQIGIAASAQPAPIVLLAAASPADAPLLSGGRFPLTVQLRRGEGFQNRIRLRLLTTQVTPRKKEKQNNQDVEVDDLERTLRLEGAPEYGPETAEATVELLVPADLPEKPWGVSLAADVLAADNKTVQATFTSPTLQLTAKRSLALELSSGAQIEAKAGGGDTGQFTGKIVRMAGFEQPVTVTLVGLPPEYPAPQVVVAAGESDFVLPVRFPYEAKAADLQNVRLKASGLLQPDNEKSRLASNEVPVSIKVVAGQKTE